MRRLFVAGLMMFVGIFGVTASGAAAAPAPAWTIQATPYPSAFEAGSAYGSDKKGPAYLVEAVNVGGTPTSGEFTITDTLPPGLLPTSGFPPTGGYGQSVGNVNFVVQMSCSALGRRITCTGGEEDPVEPGAVVSVVVPVEVQANAAEKAAAAGGFLSEAASIEGGGAAAASTVQPTPVSAAASPFGFLPKPAGLYGMTGEADGSPVTQAGSHPYQMTVAGMNLTMNPYDLAPLLPAGGGLRDAVVQLPRGMVVNPAAAPRCSEVDLETELGQGVVSCPDASQVGTIALTLSLGPGFGTGSTLVPVYNMVPPPGYPAALAFQVVTGTYVHLLGSVSSDGSFTLTAASRDVLARVAVGGVRTTLWGVPSDPSHDTQRGACIGHFADAGCVVPRTHRPFLTMPSSCGGPLTTKAKIDGWEHPGAFVEGSYESTDLGGNRVGVDGCGALEFGPTLESRATTNQGDSPSGLDFNLHQPQHEGSEELATANLKDVRVNLPEGMTVNPSAAAGLEGCSAAQIGLASPIGADPVRFLEDPAQCPDAAKLGSAEAIVPLLVDEPSFENQLPHPLHGSVYLAKPFDNPFGSLLGLYLVIEDEETGVIAKLAGKVEANPATGQLTTSFAENPELPLEDVKLSLFGGADASLTSPLACGTHTTTSTLTPWSTPEGADAHPSDSFQTTGNCSASESSAPTGYSFTAGTVDPLAGAFSPFVLKLSRPDGSQRLTGLDLTLPEGLTGKLAGVPYCSEAQIAQARARSNPEEGKLEIQSPSCPQASEVGTVTVAAGSGPSPIYVTGHAYWAGPYKGAPLSMAIITPAVAGPFDLGVVVVRVALQVNLETAQISAKSDPLPTILQGIPLDIRSVAVQLGRPGFTLNPTDCEASSVGAQVSTAAGQIDGLSNRFQVGGCDKLGFKPKLKIQLKGATRRSGHPALKAVVTMPPGGANLARVQVGLPHSEFLDQGNLDKVCTQPQLKAASCPAGAVYGHAKAWSPLLEKPLEGPVYLGVGYGHELPDLVADLNGQIRILAHGKVDTTKKHGLRNTFEVIPDAPVSRIVLEMKGGKKYGLLENSENVCRKTQRVSARFAAQNGKVAQLHPKIVNGCGRKHHKRHARHHGKRHG